MDLKSQRRMAAEILKCGHDKVWMDPSRLEDISQAITKEDIRNLIREGAITKKKVNYQSRGRARIIARQKEKGRRRGRGSRKGKKTAKEPKKEVWMRNVRALRRELRRMRDNGLSRRSYRKLYLMVKGGFFRGKAHLRMYVRERFRGEEGGEER
ncbi:MAG: 50S ribosomal protein L19e [Candidatus Aenigmatarchaeota archaeon]|nr:MAG: 50S ribosomal protein L19e [Candidatus Aenigmarchaeota archaeon]